MTRLILSTNNIVLENYSVIRGNNSEWAESDFSMALRNKFLAAQNNLSNFKSPGDGKVEELQIRSQISGWTLVDQPDYYIPTSDWSASPLVEDRDQYEITVKIFFLSEVDLKNKEYANDAVKLALRKLDVKYIDLLIISFPKILSKEETEGGEESDVSDEEIENSVATWTTLTLLYEQGTVKNLGVADLNSKKLAKFLKRVKIRPQVNQIYVKNCCNINPSLRKLAKMENIELLTHHDQGNILPKFSLDGIPRLDRKDADLPSQNDQPLDGVKNKLSSKWVVKYTTVVRDRGVIENKGYLIAVELVGS